MKKITYIPVVLAVLIALLAGSAFAADGIATINPYMTGVQAIGSNTILGAAYTTNDLIPLTVNEAWQLSGRNADNFSVMVQQLAEVSARNRGLTFVDTQDRGREIGQMIVQRIRSNPNQLLYEAVDSAIKDYSARFIVPAGAGAGPSMVSYSANQLLPLTVAQAWRLSGQNYDQFGLMIRTLAEVSADHHGIGIPDTATAGTELGRIIRQKAEADPNQLLYVVVDSSIRDYALRLR